MQGSGFRVQGSGFRVQGAGFRVEPDNGGARVEVEEGVAPQPPEQKLQSPNIGQTSKSLRYQVASEPLRVSVK